MSLSLRTVLPGISPAAALSSLPICSSPYCPRPATLWQRWWSRHEGLWLSNRWYCCGDCFRVGLLRRLEGLGSLRPRSSPAPNRIPLGLLLLSHGHISRSQLRQALALQKSTKSGKIGEWLVRMGAVSEQQVVSALGIQQRCPVFAGADAQALPGRLHWPASLVQRYRAVPVFYKSADATLYVGFLEQINHGFLYSLEQVLHCRTLPCMVPLSGYRERAGLREVSGAGETIEILQLQHSREMMETVSNYAEQARAETCSLACCDDRLWIRLESPVRSPIDFLFRPASAGA